MSADMYCDCRLQGCIQCTPGLHHECLKRIDALTQEVDYLRRVARAYKETAEARLDSQREKAK